MVMINKLLKGLYRYLPWRWDNLSIWTTTLDRLCILGFHGFGIDFDILTLFVTVSSDGHLRVVGKTLDYRRYVRNSKSTTTVPGTQLPTTTLRGTKYQLVVKRLLPGGYQVPGTSGLPVPWYILHPLAK